VIRLVALLRPSFPAHHDLPDSSGLHQPVFAGPYDGVYLGLLDTPARRRLLSRASLRARASCLLRSARTAARSCDMRDVMGLP
jgi:hypothetical protein